MTCLVCLVSNHNGHDLANIDSKTRKIVEKQIEILATNAELKLIEFEENLECVTEVEKKKIPELGLIKFEINSLFDSLVTRLQTRRAALLEEAEEKHNKDMKELWAQKDYIGNTIAGLRGALNLAKRSLQSHDLGLLAVGSQSIDRLKELGELHWSNLSTEAIYITCREFVFKKLKGVNSLGHLQSRICSPIKLPSFARLGHVVNLKTPIRFTSRWPMLRRQSEKPCVTIFHGKSRVATPYSPAVTRDPDGEMWDISFTPVVSGDHVVEVEEERQSGKEVVLDEVVRVSGIPPIGTRVQQGPDWRYSDVDRNGGGTVIDIKIDIDRCTLSIKWDSDKKNPYYHKWCVDCYDVQLTSRLDQ